MATAGPAGPGDIDRKDLLRVSGASALVALPISLVAFGFLGLVDLVQRWVWETAPAELGFDTAPWWWPIPWLLVAGLLVSSAIVLLPGRGGHVPANGTGAGITPPSSVPGVFLAALAGLPLGVVLGPEAPLIAMGTGLAVWLSRLARLSPHGRLEALIGTAGAAAAISIVLGDPLTAVIFLAEAVAIAGGPVIAATIPALLGVGVGALMFSGLGDTPGVRAQSLQLVELASVPAPGIGDLLWAVPVGVVAAAVMTVVFTAGRRVADRLDPMRPGRLVVATMTVGVGVALCASAYALITGRSAVDVASSGTATLEAITSDTTAWGTGALVALIGFKGLAYALSLGAFRGGPIFPSIMLGGALGVLIAPLPGLGVAGGLAVGMAAFAAAGMRMPLSSVALTLLLFGPNATEVFPEVAIAAVTAFAVRVALDRRKAATETETVRPE
ncbi:MAG TPA: chloride channel protein [Jiangellales bacterium]|nr:chloride channel protein [Jiangellales bacterium]